VDSTSTESVTNSAIGYIKGCVKKENFWKVAKQSRAYKNNNNDKQLVIGIFSRKV
jgi:hypothetical protein